MSFVYTFGCRLNSYESECIKNIINSINLNAIVVNTCTITNEAEKQCRQKIRQLKTLNKDSIIIATGCATELHIDMFFNMPEVDFVIDNEAKLNKNAYIKAKENKDNEKQKSTHMIFGKNLQPNDEEISHIYDFENKSRAFLKIQDGCNHYCSFCIVPFVRGKMKSTSIEKIIKEVDILTGNGYREIILTGVDITDYGTDLKDGSTLSKLCVEILEKCPDVLRLRLSSVDVAEIDNDMFDILKKYDKFCSYFHISLQSGSDVILKKMRRRHKKQQVIDFCKKVLEIRPWAAFGADIITGFPSETEEDFQESVDIVKQCPISFVHAFPYSKKEKTLAFSMKDDVEKEVKKKRVKILIEEGLKNLDALQTKMIGHEFDVIVELNQNTKASNFIDIAITENLTNKQMIKVKCKEIVENKLIGEVI